MTENNQETVEQPIAERRSEIAKRMHIAEMDKGFYVLEIPGADGAPVQLWTGPFWSRRAAGLFVERLLDAYAKGDPELAICYPDFRKFYEEEVRLLEFFEKQEGISDPCKLVLELRRERPWEDPADETLPW